MMDVFASGHFWHEQADGALGPLTEQSDRPGRELHERVGPERAHSLYLGSAAYLLISHGNVIVTMP